MDVLYLTFGWLKKWGGDPSRAAAMQVSKKMCVVVLHEKAHGPAVSAVGLPDDGVAMVEHGLGDDFDDFSLLHNREFV